MDRHPIERKQEPNPPARNTGQDPATPASQVFQTGDADQIQPLDRTGNGSKTCENYVTSVGESVEFEDGTLPRISTIFNKLPPYRCVSAEESGSDDGGSENVTSGSCLATGVQVSAVKLLQSGDHIVPLQDTQRLDAAGEPMNPDPVQLTSASDCPVTSFTIPPTEEDLKQWQPSQDKSGYIKQPPNAFIVWSHIHRNALRKTCPGANMTDVSIVLGCEWSKLSEEQKRPYYEVAHKLKHMHRQKYPDYEFRPQKKKDIDCVSSRQGAGQDPGVSFSQAMPPAQSKFQGPSMYPYPAMMAYTVGYYPYPAFCPYYLMCPNSRVQIHHQRFFHPNASSSTEDVRNYHNTDPQRDETAAEGLEQSHIATCQQLSANNKEECKCEDDVDVLN